ncbi:MAG: ABC transporter ATP-binding protein [Actinomycetia bacterium]|nr:ABC transporter ATP-binding protein [Actinomycetes bacterium]
MAETPLLSIRGLTVRYGDVEAVRGIDLDVYPGEMVTLLGANGAGKSTTLKAVCRLLEPAGGDIRFEGASLLGRAPEELVGLGIALVPERRRVFPALTVTENLEMGAYGRPREWVRAAMDDMFALFPALARYARKMAAGLSGGEQQMLAIARALMSRPKLLLLDEPSLGLAPLLVDQLFEQLRQINAGGTTVLLVEQSAWLALSVSHRAYVMESGAIRTSGPSRALMQDDHVRAAYLGVTPEWLKTP